MEPLHTENRVARSKNPLHIQWSEGVCYSVGELLIFDLQKKKKKICSVSELWKSMKLH